MSDEQIEDIHHLMQTKCEEFRGSPVLFELLDMCREYLTNSNIPNSAPCSICLYKFEDKDVFCKTNCFHHSVLRSRQSALHCLPNGLIINITRQVSQLCQSTSMFVQQQYCR